MNLNNFTPIQQLASGIYIFVHTPWTFPPWPEPEANPRFFYFVYLMNANTASRSTMHGSQQAVFQLILHAALNVIW